MHGISSGTVTRSTLPEVRTMTSDGRQSISRRNDITKLTSPVGSPDLSAYCQPTEDLLNCMTSQRPPGRASVNHVTGSRYMGRLSVSPAAAAVHPTAFDVPYHSPQPGLTHHALWSPTNTANSFIEGGASLRYFNHSPTNSVPHGLMAAAYLSSLMAGSPGAAAAAAAAAAYTGTGSLVIPPPLGVGAVGDELATSPLSAGGQLSSPGAAGQHTPLTPHSGAGYHHHLQTAAMYPRSPLDWLPLALTHRMAADHCPGGGATDMSPPSSRHLVSRDHQRSYSAGNRSKSERRGNNNNNNNTDDDANSAVRLSVMTSSDSYGPTDRDRNRKLSTASKSFEPKINVVSEAEDYSLWSRREQRSFVRESGNNNNNNNAASKPTTAADDRTSLDSYWDLSSSSSRHRNATSSSTLQRRLHVSSPVLPATTAAVDDNDRPFPVAGDGDTEDDDVIDVCGSDANDSCAADLAVGAINDDVMKDSSPPVLTGELKAVKKSDYSDDVINLSRDSCVSPMNQIARPRAGLVAPLQLSVVATNVNVDDVINQSTGTVARRIEASPAKERDYRVKLSTSPTSIEEVTRTVNADDDSRSLDLTCPRKRCSPLPDDDVGQFSRQTCSHRHQSAADLLALQDRIASESGPSNKFAGVRPHSASTDGAAAGDVWKSRETSTTKRRPSAFQVLKQELETAAESKKRLSSRSSQLPPTPGELTQRNESEARSLTSGFKLFDGRRGEGDQSAPVTWSSDSATSTTGKEPTAVESRQVPTASNGVCTTTTTSNNNNGAAAIPVGIALAQKRHEQKTSTREHSPTNNAAKQRLHNSKSSALSWERTELKIEHDVKPSLPVADRLRLSPTSATVCKTSSRLSSSGDDSSLRHETSPGSKASSWSSALHILPSPPPPSPYSLWPHGPSPTTALWYRPSDKGVSPSNPLVHGTFPASYGRYDAANSPVSPHQFDYQTGRLKMVPELVPGHCYFLPGYPWPNYYDPLRYYDRQGLNIAGIMTSSPTTAGSGSTCRRQVKCEQASPVAESDALTTGTLSLATVTRCSHETSCDLLHPVGGTEAVDERKQPPFCERCCGDEAEQPLLIRCRRMHAHAQRRPVSDVMTSQRTDCLGRTVAFESRGTSPLVSISADSNSDSNSCHSNLLTRHGNNNNNAETLAPPKLSLPEGDVSVQTGTALGPEIGSSDSLTMASERAEGLSCTVEVQTSDALDGRAKYQTAVQQFQHSIAETATTSDGTCPESVTTNDEVCSILCRSTSTSGPEVESEGKEKSSNLLDLYQLERITPVDEDMVNERLTNCYQDGANCGQLTVIEQQQQQQEDEFIDVCGLDILSSIASQQQVVVQPSNDDVANDVIMSTAGQPSTSRRFSLLDIPVAQFMDSVESPDVDVGYNVPTFKNFADADLLAAVTTSTVTPRSSVTMLLSPTQRVACDVSSDVYAGDVFTSLKVDCGAENMDAMELDMRMRLADLQTRYRKKQRELAKLQRRRSVGGNEKSSYGSAGGGHASRRRSTGCSGRSRASTASSGGPPSNLVSPTAISQRAEEMVVKTPDQKKRQNSTASDSKVVVKKSKINNDDHHGKPPPSGSRLVPGTESARVPEKSLSMSSSTSIHKRPLALSLSPKADERASPKRTDGHVTLSHANKPETQAATSGVSDESQQVAAAAAAAGFCADEWYRRRSERIFLHKTVESTATTTTTSAATTTTATSTVTTTTSNASCQPLSAAVTLSGTPKSASGSSSASVGKKLNAIGDTNSSTGSGTVKYWNGASSDSMNGGSSTLKSVVAKDPALGSAYRIRQPNSYSTDSAQSSTLRRLSAVTVTTATAAATTLTTTTTLVNVCPRSATAMSSSSSSSESESEATDTDDMPLSSYINRNVTADDQVNGTCTLKQEDIVDGLRVLFLKEGLLYEGTIKEMMPPDVYGVTIDGERGNRSNIVTQEELLRQTVLVVRPMSTKELPIGSRVCAFWSQKFSCLHPGTVCGPSTDSEDTDTDDDEIRVDFDDGDAGKIPLDFIRMLPPDFPVQEKDDSLDAIIGCRRRRRSMSTDQNISKRTPAMTSSSSATTDTPSKGADNASKVTLIAVSSAQRQRQSTSPSAAASDKMAARSEKAKKISGSRRTSSTGVAEGNIIAVVSPVSSSNSELKLTIKRSISHTTTESNVSVRNDSSDDDDDETDRSSDSDRDHRRRRRSSPEAVDSRTSSDLSEDDGVENDDDVVLRKRKRSRADKKNIAYNSSRRMITSDTSSSSSSDSEDSDDDHSRSLSTAVNGKRKKSLSKSQSKSASRRKRRRRNSSSSSQVGSFLSVDQQWRWIGSHTQRPGSRGRARKLFYKAIRRGDETIQLGDNAVFISDNRHLKYIGHVIALWEGWDGGMYVRVKWFYHPEETKGGKNLVELKGALYQSSHEDENDVQTISHKCHVVSYTQYRRYHDDHILPPGVGHQRKSSSSTKEDVYYLAGSYDPISKHIVYERDVKLACSSD